ncbi:hypothetical protein LFL97_18970 [Burkholderia sp. JSH-S8]|nr:hypothetical protein LFL97_18970 [Burkholderia sp. JSH-S8]
MKRFLANWILPEPLASCFGGGWRGIVIAAVAKTALCALINAFVLDQFETITLSTWLASVAVMFLFILGIEASSTWCHRR